MRPIRLVLTTGIAVSLLAGSAMGISAQEVSPEPTASPSVPLDAEPLAEPLPVADYWGEWAVHKQAAHRRVQWAVDNASRARAKTKAYYRALVGVHDDELQWLGNHQPEDCYRDEFDRWREATEDLRSIAKRTVRQGMQKTRKQRRAAIRQLDRVVANFADCPESLPAQADANESGNPLVGSWRSLDDFVEADGFRDRNRTSLTIAADGAFVNRDPKNILCRREGLGYVPLTWRGSGEFIADDNPVFAASGRVHCYPKGGRKLVFESGSADFRYDATADVLIRDDAALCYWRDKAGSPRDCVAYWRGTQPASDDAEPSAEEDAASEEEAADAPDDSEG